jgi:ribosomal protein L7Ae-like RNA K-turn-binding protein
LNALLGQFGSVDLPDVAAYLVVLAGDIDRGIKSVVWARQAFPGIPVLYVVGSQAVDRRCAAPRWSISCRQAR